MSAAWTVDAVLLDMDGTLVDTETVYHRSLIAALNAYGYSEGAVALCHAMIGLPATECQQMLVNHYGDDFPLAAVNEAFAANQKEILRDGLPLKAGARDLLDALEAAQRLMAIVTSSSRRSAERHLTLAGIRPRFDIILTRDDVVHCKPSPDLYLLAAERLGVAPQACVAIEDSNHGVTSAHAAGAITLMVPDMVPPTEESRSKCAAVLPDLNAALALLRERGAL